MSKEWKSPTVYASIREKRVLESLKLSKQLIDSDFWISLSFSYDLPVFVSTLKRPGNSKIFMFYAKQRKNINET